jgi:polar amino acid transport system substrate-binding protein
MRWPRALVLGLLAGLSAAACGRDETANAAAGEFTPLEAERLTVATQFPAPGFWEGSDADHVTAGFEYELALDLADQLGLDEVQVVEVPFDRLVEGRADGFDLALAQVSVTHERAEVVELSEVYLTTPVGVIGRPGLDVPDLETARGLTWGVAASTTEVDVLDDLVRPDDEPTVYATTARTVRAVLRDDVDVAALDYLRGLAEVDEDDRLALVAQITAPQHYAALLPKGSSNLEAVDAAIRRLRADGTLRRLEDELNDRFDVDVNDVPTIRVTPR